MLPGHKRAARAGVPARYRRIKSSLDSFQDTMRQTSAADVARAQSTLDSLGIGSPRSRRQTLDDAMMRGGSSRRQRSSLSGPSMRRVQSSVDVRRHSGSSGIDSSGLHAGRQALIKSGTQSSLAEEPAKDWDLVQAFSNSIHVAMAQPSRPLFPSLQAPALADVRVVKLRDMVNLKSLVQADLRSDTKRCCHHYDSFCWLTTGQAWRL
jgi:hypothetical protein